MRELLPPCSRRAAIMVWRLLLLGVFLSVPWGLRGGRPVSGEVSGVPLDLRAARQWCDSHLLRGPEGIWEFPLDGAVVMVRRSLCQGGVYDITVLETPDCRLWPGDKIGSLSESADPDKFSLELYTGVKKDLLSNPRRCLAQLSRDGYVMLMERTRYKISLRSLSVLPRFWRMLRFSVDDPLERLPEGLRKVYPTYDGNGTRPGEIRVL